ncbi:MAG TPA: Uma2 family endonuclease, partial [Lacipirellulaceae bacterium]
TPASTLGPYRAADYWQLPEGEPVELLRGRLVRSPAPDTTHQTISGLLTVYLFGVAARSGGRALDAPVDVVLDDHTILQPDLLYVRKERRSIVQTRMMGPPDLLVEILSPHNFRRDRVDKLGIYAEYGVAEYWIVDPVERQFDFLINRGGKYEVQPQQDDHYASPICPELEINLVDFWQSVDEQLGSG